MISVMLLTVSLMTLGLLAVRTSTREVSQAGQLVARERALMVAEAAVDLATARYIRMEPLQVDAALMGYNDQGDDCVNACGDCVPGRGIFVTGRRNDVLAGSEVDCGGRPCMRQGSVSFLRDANGADVNWCQIPFRDLVTEGDSEAIVSVWVRNNSADALGTSGSGTWINDSDGVVVITAQVDIRNTSVTVEQEVRLAEGQDANVPTPSATDEGYGGGHNNDNSAVAICTDNFVRAEAS
jgi:hypothetical protein